MLYEYAKKFNVPHINTKKIIVANNDLQMHQVQQIKVQAETNGVENLEVIDEKQVNQLEPLIKSAGGLLVPSTGVIDQHTLMQSYLGEFENNGGMISYNSNVKKISIVKNKFEIEVVDNENTSTLIICDYLINAAGIFASDVANTIEDLDKKYVPKTYLAKGNYFSLNKKLPITHLIYPVPEKHGLGVHTSSDIENSLRFGPDAEVVEEPNYIFDSSEERRSRFIESISKYFKGFDSELLGEDFCGIRARIGNSHKGSDFSILFREDHGIEGLINIAGIESPGLTASLAIARYVSMKL